MLKEIKTELKRLDGYLPIVGEEEIYNIRKLAKNLKNIRILHIDSTAYVGGVAEMLHNLVPLMRDVGLDVEWRVIEGNKDFFNITKKFHNALQGADITFTKEMKRIYFEQNKLNAGFFKGEYDFVIIHDPQPAAMLAYLQASKETKFIWRCHIDTSNPNIEIWNFLRDFLKEYDAAIFTLKKFVKDKNIFKHLFIILPSIDPLSDKNRSLARKKIEEIARHFDVDPERPLITQISRFDPWKDPLGVIDVYRLIKRDIPELQLALIGSMPVDDPEEGWIIYEKVLRRAGEDEDIHILSDLRGVGNLEVNAFQRLSRVIIQKSLREGFGLTVSEGLWKERPVVGGKTGGITIQIMDGRTGFLVESVREAVEKTKLLLLNKETADKMGREGKRYVRSHFLITRQLKDYLSLFNSLL
ncbi:MAG: glycosyltransferase [Candidatus Aerophobetes bacterium]|nr:glycosyltransferase [Candidatus Aerophobetes bacterium]